MRNLATDIGFGYTKASDGHQSQIFKSIVGEANESQFGGAMMQDSPATPRQFSFNGEDLFVGELAEHQSRARNFTLDPSEFLTRYVKTLGLAALAPYAAGADRIRLVTGLPISHYRKFKQPLIDLLQQQHHLTVVENDGGRHSMTVDIDQVRVIPQPFGSLFNLMLDDSGQLKDERFSREKIGVIDVGFRTVDYTISDKTRYSERGSLSTDSGISLAYTAIATQLQERSGSQVELYRLYEAVTSGSIKIKGQRYDLREIVDQAFTQLAIRIAGEANRLWADDWDIDAIVLTGGGGATLAPFLTHLVHGEVLPVASDHDIRFDNVMGYLKYGNNLWPEWRS